MRKIYNNIKELIGNTPMLKCDSFKNNNLKNNKNNNLYTKLEYFNPSGSVKDRVALNMINEGERLGLLKKGSVIIEPTSGNTGIGIAAIGAYLGYKVILTMPDTMSMERRLILKAYGAEIVLSKGADGMAGAIKLAEELGEKYKNSFIPSQFENKANAMVHFKTTGVEIWDQLDGKIDYLVATIGTGGTITGVGEFLKSKNLDIKIIGVEPENSPVLSKGEKGSHKIQGIGAGFVPDILNTQIYNEIITVSDEDAMEYSREFAKTEGILVGISSGAALRAGLEIARKVENKNIVIILPDTGERYLSTELYN